MSLPHPPRAGHAARPVCALFAIVLLVTGCGSSDERAAAAWPAGQPAWAIQGEEPRGAVIQVVDAEGAHLRSLVGDLGRGDQNNPDWSPDGGQLTFTMRGDDGKDDLWVADVDGTDARLVYDCAAACDYLDDPAWSPDGTSIAACALGTDGDDHLGSLVGVDIETGAARALFVPSDPRDFCAGPRWSPDGEEVVLELVHREDTSLDAEIVGVTLSVVDVSADPAAVRALTDPSLFAATADWSPDGATIVYAALPAPGAAASDLFAIEPQGGEPTRLTRLADEGASAAEPAFDAAGSSVVFVSSDAASLMRVPVEGGDPETAFASGINGAHPRARPAPSG